MCVGILILQVNQFSTVDNELDLAAFVLNSTRCRSLL
jgi:hypothetical protein